MIFSELSRLPIVAIIILPFVNMHINKLIERFISDDVNCANDQRKKKNKNKTENKNPEILNCLRFHRMSNRDM